MKHRFPLVFNLRGFVHFFAVALFLLSGCAVERVAYRTGAETMDGVRDTPANNNVGVTNVAISITVKANGFGFVDPAVITAIDGFKLSNGSYSLYSDAIVDAEKIDGTDLDDRGCGEAVGSNMAVMTGWGKLAGFVGEDDIFRSFYRKYGTASNGVRTVIQYVFERLPNYSYKDFYKSAKLAKFDLTTFLQIEEWLDRGCAVGIMYFHGTPAAHNGNHVVTLWGICKNNRYPASDPRHYVAVIISDSDDDKRGYAMAETAPNRLRIVPVSWNEKESVYNIANGYLVQAMSLAPPPQRQF